MPKHDPAPRKISGTLGVLLCLILLLPGILPIPSSPLSSPAWSASDEFEDPFAEETVSVADPLEPLNRVFFQFNDRFYFWVLKPVAKLYSSFLPPGLRIAIRRAYENSLAPVWIVNNFLQGKIKEAGIEILRAVINTTMGVGGLLDPAETEFGLHHYEEDFGQTLAVYGFGNGFYINWPILGPSTLRDSCGVGADMFLDPISYAYPPLIEYVAIKVVKHVNNTSLRLGEYEDLKASALDPYVALRDAYINYRAKYIQQ